MNGDRSRLALARIEAALARLEAASQGGGDKLSAEFEALRGRHARLRQAVMAGLDELDSLIEGAKQ
jgi:hypothetical protein